VTCELLKEPLKKYNRESEWIEFKENNKPANPENRSAKHIKYIPFYG